LPESRAQSNTCASCHEAIAVEEADPEILKTLGIAG
jgi:hypothetical protein